MKLITFINKITKKVSSEEEQYKITAENINEIKEVVNENAKELTISTNIITTT